MPFFASSKAPEPPVLDASPIPASPAPPPQPREVLNVPTGNAPISPEPRVLGEADLRTGDTKTDVMAAIKVRSSLDLASTL